MKRIGLWIVVALVAYVTSFLIFGRLLLASQLIDDSNSTYDSFEWTKNIWVISNLDVRDRVCDHLFNAKGIRIEYKKIRNREELQDIDLFRKSIYYYALITDKYSPITKIHEWEHIKEYTAVWEKKYVWVFFRWIKFKEEMTGIS